MKKILVRAGKTAFSGESASETIRRNLIANNNGNLLFTESVQKSLAVKDTIIDVSRYAVESLDPDYINDNYDAFVMPFANAFRSTFEAHLRAHTSLIKRLKIPCVVVGIGAQTDLEHSQLKGSKVDDAAKEFVAAVLDKSATIGVRGEYTREYLAKLGFNQVETIGCPSMFYNGPNLKVEKRVRSLGSDSKISINITSNQSANIGQLLVKASEIYPRSNYLTQDMSDAHLLLWGKPRPEATSNDLIPSKINDPFLRDGRALFFTDVRSWIDHLKTRDFSIGTRIHGNVFSLLAGTPAMVIAHDSRTLELAQYFQIPHIRSDEITPETSISELYQSADFAPMIAGHSHRFSKYQSFLERNGLSHIWADPNAIESFNRRAAQSALFEPITPIDIASDAGSRLALLHAINEKKYADASKRIARLEKEIKKLTAEKKFDEAPKSDPRRNWLFDRLRGVRKSTD